MRPVLLLCLSLPITQLFVACEKKRAADEQLIGYWVSNHERTMKQWELSGFKIEAALQKQLMELTDLWHFEEDGEVTLTNNFLTRMTGTYTFDFDGESTGTGEAIFEMEGDRAVISLSLDRDALSIKPDLSKTKFSSKEEEAQMKALAGNSNDPPAPIFTRIEEGEFMRKLKELKEEGKPVEEKQQEVKPEEPVAENKPTEAVSVSPPFLYETEDDVVTITGCDRNASGALTIPATIEGKTVTSIGDSAFVGCRSLTDITIPDGVTSIGDWAFNGCSSLTSIIFGENSQLTSIGQSAFSGCFRLFNITIGQSVTSIGSSAFNGCSSLKSVTIPDSVTNIGSNAFLFCKNLTNITFGESSQLTSIGHQAFGACSSLTSITIGNSVTSIGETAFLNCASLTSITIGDGVTSIGYRAFQGCTDLSAVTFLGDAPKAGESVFSRATPTIYHNPEAKGWGDTFAGRPVKLISEKP